MKILSITTSSNICAVAVLEDNKLIKEISLDNGLTHSETLMPCIKKLFEELKMNLRDIDLITCDIGPGSFTGIRIGVASAKAISDSLEIKALGICSLEALAYNSPEIGLVCSILDAKNGNVYGAVYEHTHDRYILRNNLFSENISDLLNDLKKYKSTITFVGDGAKIYKEQILNSYKNCKFIDNNNLCAYYFGLAGLTYYNRNVNPALLPLYLKKPQAERMLEEKKKSKEVKIKIDKFSHSDLESISSCLKTDFDSFWTYNIIKKELDNPSNSYICLKKEDSVIGFAGITCIQDTAELNFIVIKKSERGNGFSYILLDELKKIAISKNCTTINLEVACNNIIAVKVYKKLKFRQVGRRKGYYNGTDALLFSLYLNKRGCKKSPLEK